MSGAAGRASKKNRPVPTIPTVDGSTASVSAHLQKIIDEQIEGAMSTGGFGGTSGIPRGGRGGGSGKCTIPTMQERIDCIIQRKRESKLYYLRTCCMRLADDAMWDAMGGRTGGGA
jgi:hypothetical protein